MRACSGLSSEPPHGPFTEAMIPACTSFWRILAMNASGVPVPVAMRPKVQRKVLSGEDAISSSVPMAYFQALENMASARRKSRGFRSQSVTTVEPEA